jgi:cytolysin (calcineurin-like family phosphatase)
LHNGKSRDALAVLDADLNLAGKPDVLDYRRQDLRDLITNYLEAHLIHKSEVAASSGEAYWDESPYHR